MNEQPKRKTWLWVLGWIFCFPIPVMVLIWRKKNTWKTPIKIAVTIVFWILLFVLLGSRDSDTASEETAGAPVEEVKEELKEETPVEASKETSVEEVEPTEFEVSIDVKGSFEGEKAIFDVETNLPDNTELMLSLRSGDYNTDTNFTAQTKVTVRDGKAKTEGFSNKGEKLKGDFDLSVSLSLPKLQDESVRKVIGENGEYMGGKAVEKSTIGDANAVSALFAVNAGDEIIITSEDDYSSTTFREEDDKASAEDVEGIMKQYENADEETRKVAKWVDDYVKENYTYTDIDNISVNPNLGTNDENDYILLVYLTWNQKNKADTTKKMIDMYSSDMAVRVYQDIPEISEMSLFWTVPYLNNGNAKISFEKADGGMKYTDTVYDKKFN
ncbi:MAG: hypothetical protein K5641_00435 [Lachnospiraceae bacterium]|nr:hypothetical protein [Lachnospiraceae bacterium]